MRRRLHLLLFLERSAGLTLSAIAQRLPVEGFVLVADTRYPHGSQLRRVW